MVVRLAVVVATVLAPLLLLAAPAAALEHGTGADLERVDSYVAQAMEDRDVPGAALVVVRDGRIVHAKGYGRADSEGRPVTPQTPFRIGSVTKSFTALAVMQLVEDGTVALDAPVRRYLPWFTLADEEAAGRITVAHLLHHTSGIPGRAGGAALFDPARTLEDTVRALAEVAPDRPVGESFEYANVNYAVLGLLLEEVSGQSYADYVREHVLDPLEMRHSFATATSGGRGELAVGHQWFFGVPVAVPDRYVPGHVSSGFLSAGAEDLGHWLIAHMEGGRYDGVSVLSPEGIETLHAPGPGASVPGIPGVEHAGGGYAMGWFTGEIHGVPAVWHGGGDLRNSAVLVMAEDGWGMALLVNSGDYLTGSEPTAHIASGVVRLLDGKEPVPLGRPSIGYTYRVLDLVLAALTLPVLAAAVRLPWWYRGLRRRFLANGPGRRTTLTVLRVAVELLLPVAALTLGPELALAPALESELFASWRNAWAAVPDLVLWLSVVAGVLLAVGLVRGVLLARELARSRRPAPDRRPATGSR